MIVYQWHMCGQQYMPVSIRFSIDFSLSTKCNLKSSGNIMLMPKVVFNSKFRAEFEYPFLSQILGFKG